MNIKRRIKSIRLTDGKMLFYPSDEEWNKLYEQIETVEIEETYSKAEWEEKFVVVRMDDEETKNILYSTWKDKTGLW